MAGHRDPFGQVKDLPTVIQGSMVLAAGLIIGEVVFGIVAISSGWGQPPGDITIAAIMAGLLMIEVPAFLFAPKVVTRNLMKKAQGHPKFAECPEACVGAVYQSQMLVKFALVEGASLKNLVAFMLGHHLWSLGIVGGLVMCQLAIFPSKHRIETWVEDQLQAVRDKSEWSE